MTIKKSLILAVLLFSIIFIMAQDTKTFSDKEFTILAGPSFTNIKNDNLLSDKYASSKGSIWFNLGFNYCKYFGKNIGLILGLEYSMYKNVTTYKGAYRGTEKLVDSDGYIYYPVSEANYKDTRTVHAGEVPIGLRLQVPISDKAQFFIDFGMRLCFIGGAKIESNGTLDKKGAYPNPNFSNVYLYIENDPYYGFTSSNYSSKIDIPVNRVSFGYFIGGGVKAKLTENTFILINPAYMKGISDITSKTSRPDYVNVFGEKSPHKKFILTQFSLRVGLGFIL